MSPGPIGAPRPERLGAAIDLTTQKGHALQRMVMPFALAAKQIALFGGTSAGADLRVGFRILGDCRGTPVRLGQSPGALH